MKLIELFENKISEYITTNNQYGAWVDTTNRKVWEVKNHERFFDTNILPTLPLIEPNDKPKFLPAYNNNWVRIIWPNDASTSQQISLSGNRNAIKQAWRLISKYIDVKSLDVIGVDIRTPDGKRNSAAFFCAHPEHVNNFIKK
ncbi:MAG: hypothetical protein HC836_37625 [Richelia sp. RM2_1_2]|nr:hypothetical protein [Richelia sp. RM2_1_2]